MSVASSGLAGSASAGYSANWRPTILSRSNAGNDQPALEENRKRVWRPQGAVEDVPFGAGDDPARSKWELSAQPDSATLPHQPARQSDELAQTDDVGLSPRRLQPPASTASTHQERVVSEKFPQQLCNPVNEAGSVTLDGFEGPLPEIACPQHVADVIAAVQEALHCVRGAWVRPFGSSVNGFGDATSDVDLVIAASLNSLKTGLDIGNVSRRDHAPRVLSRLETHLRQAGFVIEERVLHAKVPILKMRYGKTDCDLSCNNLLPVFNTQLLRAYADANPRVVDLLQETKRWAKANGVHGAFHGHFSSYAFGLLVIFYMQRRGALPCLQRRAADEPLYYRERSHEFNVAVDSLPTDWRVPPVEVTLADFARFYTEDFQWGRHVVCVRTGEVEDSRYLPELNMKILDRVSFGEGKSMLHIEDPFDVGRNLNIVLSPGNCSKLWYALGEAAASRQHIAETTNTARADTSALPASTTSASTSPGEYSTVRESEGTVRARRWTPSLQKPLSEAVADWRDASDCQTLVLRHGDRLKDVRPSVDWPGWLYGEHIKPHVEGPREGWCPEEFLKRAEGPVAAAASTGADWDHFYNAKRLDVPFQ